ncbi:MAG TPA: SDR family oxidoreductase [Cyclobacteriaceae bacterium]|nr:SDR family oxidoreductase [Cyclobacteriaceae bacterium]
MSKTVLITGCSTGIGKTVAAYFQAMGWNVAATMRNPENETELTELENLKCIRLDVQDEESIAKAIDEAMIAFGNIDVVVNNAGYGTIGPFEAASNEQIYRLFDTNVFGVMNVTRAILPYFREKRQGTIINIASTGGRMTWPLYTLYHATKWAVEGFSESLQYELRPFNIRVKIIEPGSIKTDFWGRSQEVVVKKGLDAYESYVNTVVPNLQKSGANAPEPEVVASTVYRAATDNSWQLRYQSGNGAGIFMFLRRIVPTRIFNAILRRVVERREDRLRKYAGES